MTFVSWYVHPICFSVRQQHSSCADMVVVCGVERSGGEWHYILAFEIIVLSWLEGSRIIHKDTDGLFNEGFSHVNKISCVGGTHNTQQHY